jgi:hypothetical protein
VYRDGGKFYVAGTPGHRYALELDNAPGPRAGRGVGGRRERRDRPDRGPLQSGYVLDAYENAEIKAGART